MCVRFEGERGRRRRRRRAPAHLARLHPAAPSAQPRTSFSARACPPTASSTLRMPPTVDIATPYTRAPAIARKLAAPGSGWGRRADFIPGK